MSLPCAYYNEIDPYAAQWLRNLIAAGQIAPGDVDERSIEDVRPDDIRGYTQCHFFAGIGVWSPDPRVFENQQRQMRELIAALREELRQKPSIILIGDAVIAEFERLHH